ncbi:MAG: hypothetical protein RIC14_10695 [Filomicrobium sp.]
MIPFENYAFSARMLHSDNTSEFEDVMKDEFAYRDKRNAQRPVKPISMKPRSSIKQDVSAARQNAR